MLPGCVAWPAEQVAQYRKTGIWEGITVSEMIERVAERHPDRIAVVDGERRWTYAELVLRSRQLAAGLLELGLRPRDRVVVQLPNVAEFIEAYLAMNWIGVIPVMALRAHRHAEIRHFINASGAAAYLIPDVVNHFDYRQMAGEMTQAFDHLRHVIVVGTPGAGQEAFESLRRPALVGASLQQSLAPFRPDPLEVSTMLLSGGTTSLSKLIPRLHEDYVLNARLCARAAGFDASTVWLAVLPLGHNYNLASPGLLGALSCGGRVVLASSTDTETLFELMERERVTVVSAAVPLISGWLHAELSRRFDLSSLRVVQNGGARLPPELRQRLRERFHCVPQEVYGTAEGLINMTALDDDEEHLLNSSGKPVSELDEIKVLDDQDREVPDGELGELVTRGPYMIRGYYQAEQKNREAFTPDGFYRMGDLVRKVGRYIYTEGRRKDLINRGGEKISCEEVENLIFAHPKVESVSLVAVPDERFGERACACVVLKPGEQMALEELVQFLKGRGIASFKLPERLQVMEAFPVSPVGKVMKRELREKLLTL